jgi:hypothetical protein
MLAVEMITMVQFTPDSGMILDPVLSDNDGPMAARSK